MRQEGVVRLGGQERASSVCGWEVRSAEENCHVLRVRRLHRKAGALPPLLLLLLLLLVDMGDFPSQIGSSPGGVTCLSSVIESN